MNNTEGSEIKDTKEVIKHTNDSGPIKSANWQEGLPDHAAPIPYKSALVQDPDVIEEIKAENKVAEEALKGKEVKQTIEIDPLPDNEDELILIVNQSEKIAAGLLKMDTAAFEKKYGSSLDLDVDEQMDENKRFLLSVQAGYKLAKLREGKK